MGRKKFSSIVIIFMLVPLFSTILTVTQAADVEGVSITSDSIAITPENPIAGTPISIKSTLNNSNTEVTEVDVYFYKNTYESGNPWKIQHLSLDASDGFTDSQTNITVIWQNVNINDQGIYVQILDSASDTFSNPVFKPFNVQGLPDLIIENVEISPNEEIHENDLFFVNVSILNQGTLASNPNSVSFSIEGSGISKSSTLESLDAGASTIISFNSTAPQTGTWAIQIAVDSNYEIDELSDQNNNWNGNLVITDIPDMYFLNDLVVTTTGDTDASVNGPWTLSTIIVATEPNKIDEGTNIPIEILIVDSADESEISIYENIIWNSDTNQQDLTLEFDKTDISSFSIGTHEVSLIIDPNNEHNGDNNNDIISSTFQLVGSPNIVIEIQDPPNNVINIESNYTWYVNVQNIGQVLSSGTLSANWRGSSYGPFELSINPNDSEIIAIEVETGLTKGEQTFSVLWQPDTAWMDSNNLDNTDQVSMNVDIPFVVNFDLYSLNITPSQPYIMDTTHNLQINVEASDAGSQTVECRSDEMLIDSKILTFTEQDKIDSFECDFTPNSTGLYQLKLIFVEENGQDYTMTLQIDPPDSLLVIEGEDSTDFLKLLIPFTLVLIIALIAGVILTRQKIDLSNVIYVDIEYDGYDPEELNISIGDKVMWTNYDEENKHTVSAKSLDEEGQLLFHSGDLEDHDEFLHEFNTKGKFQYGCKYNPKFSGVVNVFSDEDEDLDVIIKGSTQFASDIAEMGFKEDQLESDWDERIVEAETEVENVRSKQEAELLEDETIDITVEDEDIVMRIEDEDSELISQRGEQIENMDEILASKTDLKALKDEDVEFTASDAGMRAELYALTGEEGVMPGDEVKIGLGANKEHLEGKGEFVGNQLPNIETDFTFDDSDDVINKEVEKPVEEIEEISEEESEEPIGETAECGGCGADIPIDAKSCQICGAKFE
ncbi:MAG: CARDB domain-containing protein [Candidatus Thermoplasmatota archaeon]|nr:CARDB domain-containing protein [Candidatus Thermoplasmatota archaeon]